MEYLLMVECFLQNSGKENLKFHKAENLEKYLNLLGEKRNQFQDYYLVCKSLQLHMQRKL